MRSKQYRGARDEESAATEALKIILSLTMHLGPLGTPPNPDPAEEEKNYWREYAIFHLSLLSSLFIFLFALLLNNISV